MRRLAILALLASSAHATTLPQVSALASLMKFGDDFTGGHVQKAIGSGAKRAGKWLARPFHRKRLPDCLDVVSGPCQVKGKH